MSHITKVDGIKFINRNPIIKACEHLKITPEFNSRATLYMTEMAGTVIPLPGWRYPLVIDDAGVGSVDTYGTSEENTDHLKTFKKRYTFECLRETAARRGLEIDDLLVVDGKSKVLIGAPAVGGGGAMIGEEAFSF